MRIKGLSDCAWVTILRGESDILKSRILVASLKRVRTSHKRIAICVEKENDLSGKHSSDLISSGFDHVVSVNGLYGDESTNAILQDVAAKDILKNFKKVVVLPVDSIALKNCDELMNDQESDILLRNDYNDNNEVLKGRDGLLNKKLERFLVIDDKDYEKRHNLMVSTQTFPSLYASCLTQEDCLEEIPSIIRLPDLTSESVPKAVTSVSGILEKEIINYWDAVHKDKSLPSNTGDECTWLSEPIAIIAACSSFSAIHDAIKSALIESSQNISTISSSSCSIITSSSDPSILSDFTKDVKNSSKFFSNLDLISCPSSKSTLTTAIKTLRTNYPQKICIIFHTNSKSNISVLILKRVSQAISNNDKIQAILGPCSLNQTSNNSPLISNPDSIEIQDIIEITIFLNLRGSFAPKKSWLNLQKLSSIHKRESAVIPHFFGPSSNDAIINSFHSLVISTSYIPEMQSNYPKWDLENNYNLSRPLHCIALQHHGNLSGLEKIAENLNQYLNCTKADTISIADLAFSLNSKLLSSSSDLCSQSRQENDQSFSRGVIIASNFDDVSKQIKAKSYLKQEQKEFTNVDKPRKLCFLFTGQGSQYSGMANGLYQTCPVFRLSLDRCNFLFRKMYDIDILDVIYKNSEEISRTLYSQTSIFCVEYALMQMWKSWGIEPDYVLGHSLGEFCAAVCAGALELEDAMILVGERSRLIDELPRGKMLVLRGDQGTVQDLLNDFTRNNPGAWLDFAAINSKDQTVLSGDSKWVEMFANFAGARKVRSLVLEATHAFHSRHMEPMLEKYRRVAGNCKGDMMPNKRGGCRYISGMEGKYWEGKLDEDYWVRHTREPVRFVEACRVAWEEGCRYFVECGPQPVLSALAKINVGGGNGEEMSPVFLPSIRRGIDDWKTVLNSVGKLWVEGKGEVDWRGFEKYCGRKFLENDDGVFKEIMN